MSDNLSIDNATQRRILRFTIGVGLAVFLAAWINWQLAFVAPVFTAKFLVDKPNLHRETIYELLLALIATMGLGLLLSGGITQYPIVLLIAVGLMMAWGYYLFTDPKWNLFATILLIAVLMLPFMAINNSAISIVLASGLAISGAVSVAIFALVHIYLPEPDSEFAGYAAPRTTLACVISSHVDFVSCGVLLLCLSDFRSAAHHDVCRVAVFDDYVREVSQIKRVLNHQ